MKMTFPRFARPRVERVVVSLGMLGLLGLLGLGVSEVGIRVYVHYIAKQGRPVAFDELVGWRTRPSYEAALRDADGAEYRWRTDLDGLRRPIDLSPRSELRVLVLGDSFAAGQGIPVDDRFDTIMAKDKPKWSIVALGAQGWGTDQELLFGSRYFSLLQEGDWLVLLVYANDFLDIAMRRHFGRKKPWFELSSGQLILHEVEPEISDWLRDHVLSMLLLYRLLGSAEISTMALEPAKLFQLFEVITSTFTAGVRDRGVNLALAYHGFLDPSSLDGVSQIPGLIEDFCRRSNFYCLDLDAVLSREATPQAFQADGHWNALGNLLVANALLRFIVDASPH